MEDEASYRRTLAMNLELEGYHVKEAGDGPKAMQYFSEEHFDLCLLDVMVPEISGLHVCEHIRLNKEHVPILFISALNMPSDRVQGLKSGADDYIAKPFNLEELFLKVDRLIKKGHLLSDTYKREKKNGEAVFQFGENRVNFDTYKASGAIGDFLMTKKEADLMRLFYDNQNEVLDRERILHTVWGYSVFPNTRSIDNFVLFLRQKFEKDSKNPQHFKAIRGVGYRFTP